MLPPPLDCTDPRANTAATQQSGRSFADMTRLWSRSTEWQAFARDVDDLSTRHRRVSGERVSCSDMANNIAFAALLAGDQGCAAVLAYVANYGWSANNSTKDRLESLCLAGETIHHDMTA